MTDDIRDINSTDHTSQNLHGNTIHTVRDSLIAEILLACIIGLTLMTVLTFVKCYMEFITVGMYPQFALLIVSVLHTIARRYRIKSLFGVFVLHILVDIAFYLVAIQIPLLQFGLSGPNKFYLIAHLFAFTLFSMLYRMKPSFMAADSEFVVVPAILHIVIYAFYNIAGRKDLGKNVLIHGIMIAIIFIIMRQIAVFDTKYYHSIHKISRPSSTLKMQNYKTVLLLIGIIAVSMLVLLVFPYSILSSVFRAGIIAFLSLVVKLLAMLKSKQEYTPPQNLSLGEDLTGLTQENPWIDLLAKIIMLILVAAIITVAIRGAHALIKNAPRNQKFDQVAPDDALIDTIEDISPEKRPFFKRGPDFGTGHERRVRKQFYDKTKRAMKKGLPVSPASTPGQIESVLKENGDKNIPALRQEYEKVRYGKKKD
ncbi:MAG: hypothetical protein II696_05060 [Firmicutes bacterium]|nr:hypothetical protein [Bacillota bacterium]